MARLETTDAHASHGRKAEALTMKTIIGVLAIAWVARRILQAEEEAGSGGVGGPTLAVNEGHCSGR